MILIVLLNNPLYMGSDMVLETRILGLVHADYADYADYFRNEDLRIGF
jgi:hypothetical protein